MNEELVCGLTANVCKNQPSVSLIMSQFIYALFRFEYNSKGVPIEKLILCSSEKQLLVTHHETHFGATAKQTDLSGPLVRHKPKEVSSFSRNGGPYFGYYIDKVELLTTARRVERKSNATNRK